MRFIGTQTIYPCEEHGEVSVPLRDLVKNGELDIYPEIAGKGYFDIDYRRGTLVLRSTRYVGLIPISDRIAIHVRPKVPIANLLWMVWRTGLPLKTLDNLVRGYETRPGQIDTPETLYLEVFVSALAKLERHGPLRRYRARELDSERRGRISMAKSVSRHYSHGVRYRHAFVVTDLTVDNLENRILKHTSRRLLRHLSLDLSSAARETVGRIRRQLDLLANVDDKEVTSELIARAVPGLLRGLPTTATHYTTPLWLSYLIATRSAVVMEQIGNARFESVIIDVSSVFEQYVRRICMDAEDTLLRCRVRDGNKTAVRLFSSGINSEVQPDIYFTREGRILAVADAKYKANPTREDRYEVLAHCAATQARRAAFICPMLSDGASSGHYGTTKDGVRFELLRLDLGASDLGAAERQLVLEIAAILDTAESEPPEQSTRIA